MSNRAKGIWCIIASAFGFAVMALCIRLCDNYGESVSSFQKSFFRNALALIIAYIAFSKNRGGIIKVTWPLVLRSICGTLGIFANFYALSHIPISDGMTLNKTAPFFTVFFAWLILHERLSVRQLLYLVVAFSGALLVVKPGFMGLKTMPTLCGLSGGLFAGLAYVFLHQLGKTGINPSFIVFFFSVFSCLASVPFMIFDYCPMTLAQFLILLGAGAGAAIGQFGITFAYRFAAPRSIAVYDYTNIIFTALLGFVFLGQVPDILSALGFGIILFAAIKMRK